MKQKKIAQLYDLPLFKLAAKAYSLNKNPDMELCRLVSIKTGKCSEDCAYCAQSSNHNTNIKITDLLDIKTITKQAKLAKQHGAKRLCMATSGTKPNKTEFIQILNIIKKVKALNIEACMSLGMINAQEAQQLKQAGLDYYNHNINTSPEYYPKITSTHNFQDRINTLKNVRAAGIKVCCGGIIGMGESRQDRINFLQQLALFPEPPDSIPINRLIPIPGTPLSNTAILDNFEFIKTIAITRILFPQTRIRLAAGRSQMSQEMQAWCFMAGANSIFYGEKLLTAPNSKCDHDLALLNKLGLKINVNPETHNY